MIGSLKQTAEDAVRRARANGASDADAFIEESESFSVTVRMGEVETIKESVSRALRLRVFVGKRVATSQTSDLSPQVVEKLVDETIEMARLTSEDPGGGLPDSALFPSTLPDLQLVDQRWQETTLQERIDLARRAEQAALKADPLITNSDGGTFEQERSVRVLANTLGFVGGYEGTVGSLSAVPIAESNGSMQRDYWFSIARHRTELDAPEEVGRRAAARVLRRVGARQVSTCEVPVVFDPLTARTLVGHVFSAVAGDAVYRRRTFLADQIGIAVASPAVTIVDEARRVAGLGSSPFDDEGVTTRTTPVVEQGVLQNYLHSAYTARKLSSRPTGNGSRVGSGAIAVGPTNFYLMPGSFAPEELVESIQSGLYVVELIGMGVNPVNGDYSRGVAGLWIENGKLAYPIQEVTIAGNLRQMLKDVEMIGNDLTFMGAIAAPSIKLRSMVVSGK